VQGGLDPTFDDILMDTRNVLTAIHHRDSDHEKGLLWPEVFRPGPDEYPYSQSKPHEPLRRYVVEVLHHDMEQAECDVLEWPGPVGKAEILARSVREAAAKAWVKLVGLEREQRLIEWRAPDQIISYETDISFVASELKATDHFGCDFSYNNRVEVWYFHVQAISS
jgi:hypothetical protein